MHLLMIEENEITNTYPEPKGIITIKINLQYVTRAQVLLIYYNVAN